MLSLHLLVPVAASLAALWLALAAWVLAARLRFDRRRRAAARDARRLERGALDLGWWSRRRLWRLADGAVGQVFHYRSMMFRRRYGVVGFVGVPFFVLSEVIAPVFEVLAVAAVVAGLALQAFDVERALLMLAALALANGIITSAAVLLEDRTSRADPVRDLLRLIVLGPLDLVLYRPLIFWARLKGTWRFLRGDKGWHKFERNARAAGA